MNNSLKDYEEIFERLGLCELEVQDGEFKLKLKKGDNVPHRSVESTEPKAVVQEENTAKGYEVKAPLLGIFYGAVGEKKALQKGDLVSKGDVLCTIEAMKMMNEVKSPVDGTVSEILASDGELVEFEQVLFVIEQSRG